LAPRRIGKNVQAILLLGLLAVGVVAVVGNYYFDTYLPQHSDSDGDGWTDWDEIHTYHTDPHTPNPNAKYFVDRTGVMELLKRIVVLDADGKTDPQRKEFIDYLFNPNLHKLSVTQESQVRNRCIDQILKDGRVSIEEAAGLHLLSQYSGETQARYANFTENVFEYFHTLASLLAKDPSKKDFVDYAVLNKLRMEGDGLPGFALTALDKSFLLEPEKYSNDVFNADLKKLEPVRPDFAAELKKVQEYEQNVMGIPTGVKEAEAKEDIIYSFLKSKNPTVVNANVDEILKEGIPKERRVCTGLLTLDWHCVDNEPDIDNPLEHTTFDLIDFVEKTWKSSSISNNFQSYLWKNYYVARDIAGSSPRILAIYMRNNIHYFDDPEPRYQTAIQTFIRTGGTCGDHAMFGTDWLVNSGYEANVFSVHYYKEGVVTGHAVTLLKDSKTQPFFFLDNTKQPFGKRSFDKIDGIYGPFNSIYEAADSVSIPRPWIRYILFDINWNAIEQVIR
jgi:hypothetical protein